MDNRAANDRLDRLLGDPDDPTDAGVYGKSPVEAAREDLEDLPAWAIEALQRGERVTVRGHHLPAGGQFQWVGPEDERTEGLISKTASYVPFVEYGRKPEEEGTMMARTRTAGLITGGEVSVVNNLRGSVHPNSRHTHVSPGEHEVNINVDVDVDEETLEQLREKFSEEEWRGPSR